MIYRVNRFLVGFFVTYIKRLLEGSSYFTDFKVIAAAGRSEQMQQGITVGEVSATSQLLQPNDFIEKIVTDVYLCSLPNYPGVTLEWALKDTRPELAPAGYYVIDIPDTEHFTVSPLYQQDYWLPYQPVITLTGTPVYESKLTVNDRFQDLVQDYHYTFDPMAGTITFLPAFEHTTGTDIRFQFLQAVPQYGPFEFKPNSLNSTAIQGVYLAFGNNLQRGDRHLVCIESRPIPVYDRFGGNWQATVGFTATARDRLSAEEAADYIVTNFWRDRAYSFVDVQEINVKTFEFGGFSEVPQESGEVFYEVSFSASLELFWSVFYPMKGFLRKIHLTNAYDPKLSDADQAAAQARNFRQIGFESILGVPRPFAPGFANAGYPIV